MTDDFTNRGLSRSLADEPALKELRKKLIAGEITKEEAEAQGFPPSEPTEEHRDE
jgi:hypothetical protein